MALFDSHHLVTACIDSARRIAVPCNAQGFLCSADGGNLPSVTEYALALLLMKYTDTLPPSRQSPTLLPSNLDNAFAASVQHCSASPALVSRISFHSLTAAYPPMASVLRECIDILHALPEHHASAYARAAADIVRYVHSADYQTVRPVCLEKMLTRIATVHSGHTVALAGRYAPVLVTAAIEEAQSHQSGFVNSVSLNVRLRDLRTSESPATLCSLTTALYGNAINIRSSEQAALDTVFCIDDDGTISLHNLADGLHESGQVLYACTESHYTSVLRKTEIPDLVERDVVESITTVRPAGDGEAYVIIHIRTKKPAVKRHRLLLAERIIDPYAPGYEVAEEVAAAIRTFTTQDAHTVVTHRTKFTGRHYACDSLLYAPKRYYPDGSISLFGGVPYTEFTLLVRSLHAHKIDVARYFIESDESFVHFAPALANKQLIRIAISSAPTLRDQETRMHYALAHWWYRNESYLTGNTEAQFTIIESFSSALHAVGLLDMYVLRAVIAEWMHDFNSTLLALHHSKGGHDVLNEWLNAIIDRIAAEGTSIWDSLSLTESVIFESLAPAIMQRIRSGSEVLNSLADEYTLPAVPESVRALITEGSASLSIPERTQRVEARIAELHAFIEEQKRRIASLHVTAKKNRTGETAELFDSTIAVQDELGTIITELVPAQTELRALEHILRPLSDIAERTTNTHRTIARHTEQLPAALRQMAAAISNESATTIVLDVLRENLITAVEECITESREFIITTLEEWWDRYDVQSVVGTSIANE